MPVRTTMGCRWPASSLERIGLSLGQVHALFIVGFAIHFLDFAIDLGCAHEGGFGDDYEVD